MASGGLRRTWIKSNEIKWLRGTGTSGLKAAAPDFG
jgi:hypothetical protein